MSTNHCSPTEKDPHFYCRHQSIFRSSFFIAIFTSCVFFLSFFLVLSDLFDVVWFDPKARRFRCGQGALLSTNESEHWTVAPRDANQIGFISEEGIARGPPPRKSRDPASCEIASQRTRCCDLTICLFGLISWRESQTIQPLIYWACSSQANSCFTHLTPFWHRCAARYTSAPAQTHFSIH